MKPDTTKNRLPSLRRGFTLMELLIVITIVAVLAAAVFAVTGKVREKAKATTRLSDIRESGSLLMGIAAENNGRCAYFNGGSGNIEHRPYLMIRAEMRQGDDPIVPSMHWDLAKLPPNPGNEHWTCRAVNFQDVTYPDGTTTAAFLFDGSVRLMDKADLKIAGFTNDSRCPNLHDPSG